MGWLILLPVAVTVAVQEWRVLAVKRNASSTLREGPKKDLAPQGHRRS